MPRSIFHLPAAGVSLGVRVMKGGEVYIAVAACHPNDLFQKRVAFNVLNGRLDNARPTYPFTQVLKDKVCLDTTKSLNVELFSPIRDFARNIQKSMERIIESSLAPSSKSRLTWNLRSNLVNIKKLAESLNSEIVRLRDETPRPPKVNPRPLKVVTDAPAVQAEASGPACDANPSFTGSCDTDDALHTLASLTAQYDDMGGCV